MKAFEVAKNEARSVFTHGRIMMAVEGEESKVAAIVNLLKQEGFVSTDCAEEGDKEGEIAHFFMVDRQDKAYFMQQFRLIKKEVK